MSASGAHSVTILQTGTRHGGLWDAWKMNPNGFANFNDFVAAVMAANPSITNPNDVKAGQTVYLPERLPDGSTTYHYPNGGSQNLNPINNNCNIVTPDGEGGTIVYRRETDGDAGYSVTEIRTNAQGEATYTVRGYQDTLDGPIRNFTETQNIDTNNDGLPDRIIIGADTTGDGVADQHIDTAGDDGRLSMADLLDADQQLQELYDAGDLDPSLWHDYSDWSVRQLVSPPVIPDMPAFDTPPAPPSFDDFGDLGGYPMNWPTFDPIGAFYDSQSSAFDQAASIANQTPVLLDANYRAVSRGPFAFTNLDTNYDNQLTGNELNGLKVWVDANEDGLISTTNASGVANPATSSEIQSLRAWLSSQRLTALSASDYDRMARGNSRFADTNTSASTTSSNPTYRPTPTLLARPTDSGAPARSNSVAASNYRSLRDNDNRYTYAGGPGQFLWYYIDWQPTHIKINQGTPNSLIGTDNADSMDAAYYPTYLGSLAQFFNLGALTNFYAGGGDDQFGGSTRDDNIWGGTGNDTLYGYAGNDKMYGEEGNDISLGQDGNDVIVDNLGNNQMSGGNGNDYLDAGVGDDLLLGDAGDDTLFGGSGQDELNGGDGTDTLQGEADNDRLFGGAGSDTLWGGAGNDVMLGFTASNDPKQSLSVGETDNDVMFGQDGNDNLYGGLGNDLLDGGTGDDLIAGDAGDDTLWGADGSDALLGDVGNDVLQGGLGDDELQGGAGNDRLLGEDGVDRLFGQSGDDILYGGSGDDILVGFTASNEAQQSLNPGESDNDVLYGGEGSDLLLGQLGDDVLFGETGDDELQGGSGSDALYGGAGVDHLFGQVGDDVLYGGEGDDILMGFTASNETQQRLNLGESDNDQLYGGAGNDLLIGGLGDDFLDGGAGADDMQGGAGNDTYLVNSVNDQILERADEGYDSVIASTNYLLNAQVERLELLEGSALNGTGNAQNNTLIGNNQANILDGVTGTDLMIGQDGDDIYYVDNAGDQTIEQAGQGHDRVQSSISWTLADNLEDLTLLDFAKAEHGLVDGTAVLVYGYPKANELDYMQGDAVDNYFGTCALTSIANLITQTVRPTSEAQIVNLAINNHWALTTQDTTNPYQLGGSNYLGQQAILDAEGIRNKLLAGYNEQALANLIRGGRGVIVAVDAGKLWGDAQYTNPNGNVNHVITLTGAVYNETSGALIGFYIADSGRQQVADMTRFVSLDLFRQAANVGSAYAIYTIEPLKLWQEDIDGTGNAQDNLITGNRGENVLNGLAGNDILSGEAGNDTLDGGAGNDTLLGGLGDDILDGGIGDDSYRFNRGDGVDQIQRHVLSNANTEERDSIIFNDVTAADLRGVAQQGDDLVLSYGNKDSIIVRDYFNSDGASTVARVAFSDGTVWQAAEIAAQLATRATNGDDTLQGGTGADTLSGGQGNDTYLVDNDADQVLESTGQGSDKVLASVNYNLADNLENLTLTGSADISGGGNAQDNTLIGNEGNNLLDGGAGNDFLDGGTGMDSLMGGAGDDTYVVDNAYDAISEYANEGSDTVLSNIDYTLRNYLENLTLTGSTSQGIGNTQDNILRGNASNNRLYGLAGNDQLNGGDGGDLLDGGAGADSLQGGAGDDTLIGSAGADVLQGGSGDDLLQGGLGSDTYLFERGDGRDTLVEQGSSPNDVDVLRFGQQIAADQLWLRRLQSDLEISVIGSTDRVLLSNWFDARQPHVERIEAGGLNLQIDQQLNSLIQAMASFAPPAMGETRLSDAYRETLQPMIAASWTAGGG